MMQRLTHRAIALAAFALILGAATPWANDTAISTIADAIEANPALTGLMKEYDSPLFIPAADFRTDGEFPEAQYYSPAGYWQGDDLGGVFLMAPVWLPDGADIDSVWQFAADNDDDGLNEDIFMGMRRVDNYTGEASGIAGMSTSGESGNMQTPHELNPTFPIVDYPGYAYWLWVQVCSTDHEVYGAMVFY